MDIMLVFHPPKSKAKVAFSRQLKESQLALVPNIGDESIVGSQLWKTTRKAFRFHPKDSTATIEFATDLVE